MKSLFDATVQYFQQDDWHMQQIENRPVLRGGFKGDNGRWEFFAFVNDQDFIVRFYSVLDNRIPPDRRQVVAEFLTRANYGLPIGNFELDFSDGEVRFKTSVSLRETDDSYTFGLFKRLVYANVFTMDQYFTGIMGATYSNESPEALIKKIEG